MSPGSLPQLCHLRAVRPWEGTGPLGALIGHNNIYLA